MKRKLLILAIGFSMTLQAQELRVGEQGSGMQAPVFETSAKDEIAANRFLAGSNYLALLLHQFTQLSYEPVTQMLTFEGNEAQTISKLF